MASTGGLKVVAQGDREIVMTRVFDAPRTMVFEAWTKPELLKRWLLGPPGWTMTVCEVDLRVGGAYRFVWRRDRVAGDAETPHTMGMGGVYREITAPARLVSTEEFDDAWYPGNALNTLEMIEKDGKTTLVNTVLYDSREARDGVLKSPMEQGVAASYDRLADLLAKAETR